MHTSPRRRWGALLLRAVLFALAGWALRRELASVAPSDLWRRLGDYGWPHVLLGVGCAAASFLILAAVELLALRHVAPEVGALVPRRAAMATSFVANAFSQSVGLALLTGTAVRVRAYGRYELGAAAAARVSAFVTLTAVLGLLASGAAALLTTAAPVHVGRAAVAVRPVGALLSLPVLAYLAWSVLGARCDAPPDAGGGRWRVPRPGPALAVGQLLLSALDWLLTATVIYWLLPPALALPYVPFVRDCLVAFTLGVVSHVPGGLGVFEAVLLGLSATLVPAGGRAALAASLVMFRAVYYVAPLAAAVALAALAELRGRRAAALGAVALVGAAPRARAE